MVLEASSIPLYEPLQGVHVSVKHLTYSLLTMASDRRRSELQALVFDPKYIQFKLKGAGVTPYFSPKFMCKNQKPSQTNDPWIIPAVPSGKSDLGAPT